MARAELKNIVYAGLLGASALGIGACSADKVQAVQPNPTEETTTAATSQAQQIRQDIDTEVNKLAPLALGAGATIVVLGVTVGIIGAMDQKNKK